MSISDCNINLLHRSNSFDRMESLSKFDCFQMLKRLWIGSYSVPLLCLSSKILLRSLASVTFMGHVPRKNQFIVLTSENVNTHLTP